jgi:ATP synthase subunit 6
VSLLRPLLILACVVAPIFLAQRYTPHHEGANAFETLYMHLVPVPLEVTAHGEHGHDGHASGEQGHNDHGAGAHDAEAGGDADHGAHAGEYLLALPLPGFLGLFNMSDGRASEAPLLLLTNLQLFQIAACLLIFVVFSGVPRYLRTGHGDLTSRLFAGFALWIRDEMVLPVMGPEDGRRFLPLFLCVFFFLFFMNMMGLLPGAATPTASLFVTGALALLTLGCMLGCGMAKQGPVKFWTGMVPDVPAAMWPLMFLVEFVGLFIKPFALMIRLFANMMGGHLVVLSLMGMIFTFGAYGAVVGWGSAPISLGFAVFIMIIEFFVAMLQAYIFTMLSIMFVQGAMHPEH